MMRGLDLDERSESFQWLFSNLFESTWAKAFKNLIYTGQDTAMKNAISIVFPNTWHGLCTFHIMQNVVKHLARLDCDGSSAIAELSACMYEHEEETTFKASFSAMRSNIQNDT
jgi:transposase-like protein